jgi:hypothetical protein
MRICALMNLQFEILNHLSRTVEQMIAKSQRLKYSSNVNLPVNVGPHATYTVSPQQLRLRPEMDGNK